MGRKSKRYWLVIAYLSVGLLSGFADAKCSYLTRPLVRTDGGGMNTWEDGTELCHEGNWKACEAGDWRIKSTCAARMPAHKIPEYEAATLEGSEPPDVKESDESASGSSSPGASNADPNNPFSQVAASQQQTDQTGTQNPFAQSSTPAAESKAAQGRSTASNTSRNPFGDTQPVYRPAGGLVLPPPGSVPDDVLVAVRSQQQGNGTRPQAAGLPDDGYFEDQKRDIQQRYETAKVSGAVRPAAAPIPSFSGGMASGAPAVSADCNNRVQALGTKISSMNMGFSGNMVDTCRMSTQLINELQAALPTLRQCDPSGGAEKYVRQTIASWEPTRNSSCSMVETRTAGPTYSPTYAPPARTSGSSSGSGTSRGSGGDGYSTCNGPGCGIK